MSFSSGTFSINTAGQPVITNTTISSSVFNALTQDLATGLSTCMLKDGTQTMTANIPMSGYKFTGLGAPSTSGDSLRYGTTAANDVLINAGKPTFLVTRTSDQTNITGAGTAQTIIWQSEIFDRGSNFAANQFTAPATGIYHFSGSILLGDLTAAMTGFQVQLVTSNRTYYFNGKDGAAAAGGTMSIQFAVDADMDSADTAYINVVVSGGAGDTADVLGNATNMYTFFSGHLVA